MGIHLRLLALVGMLCVSTASTSASEDKVDQLLRLSGLKEQVQEVPKQIAVGLEQGMNESTAEQAVFAPSDLQEIKQIAVREFQPTELMSDIRQSVISNLSEYDIERLLAWYRSDIGKQITEAEKYASTVQGAQEMAQQAQSLLQTSPRLNSARKMDRLTGSSDMIVEISEFSMIATMGSMMAITKPCKARIFEKAKENIVQLRPMMQENAHNYALASFLFTYQNINDRAFNQYIEFLDTDYAQRFHRVVNDAFMDALKTSIVNMTDAMATKVKSIIERKAKEEKVEVAAYCEDNRLG